MVLFLLVVLGFFLLEFFFFEVLFLFVVEFRISVGEGEIEGLV